MNTVIGDIFNCNLFSDACHLSENILLENFTSTTTYSTRVLAKGVLNDPSLFQEL